MNRKLMYLRYLPFLVLLASCSTFTATKTPQGVIDEANVMIVAAANQIGEYMANGILTAQEAQSELDKVKKARADIKDAQKLLDDGSAILARNKAELTQRLLLELQKKLAARNRT